MKNKKLFVLSLFLVCTSLIGTASGDQVINLPFPLYGFSETIFASGNTALDGYTVTDAELFLEFEVLTGDAADVQFFMLFPVDLDPGPGFGQFDVFTNGAIQGWSGTGTFSHTFDLSGVIGAEFTADVIYTGGISGALFSGDTGFVTDNSVFQLTVVPEPSSLLLLTMAGLMSMRMRRR